MSGRRALDWSKTGTVAAMADWIRRDGDCLAVLVIRAGDSVLAVDPDMPSRDAERLIRAYLPELEADVETARREKRPAARLVPAREPGVDDVRGSDAGTA